MRQMLMRRVAATVEKTVLRTKRRISPRTDLRIRRRIKVRTLLTANKGSGADMENICQYKGHHGMSDMDIFR